MGLLSTYLELVFGKMLTLQSDNIKALENRLDKILVEKGLVSSRERAKALIQSNAVLVNHTITNKPGKIISSDDQIELLEQDIPWVSRGALKLVAALQQFSVNPLEKVCLDIGASTGGFTEVLLEQGAKLVFAVDVGHGQLVEKLRQDKRVVNLEKTHVKDLNVKSIFQKPVLCVIDVSFISLEKVLPFLPLILASKSEIIALIKPQFEVGKSNLNKQGIVKNDKLYPEVFKRIRHCAQLSGFETKEIMDSPIFGGDGNKEFLIHLSREN